MKSASVRNFVVKHRGSCLHKAGRKGQATHEPRRVEDRLPWKQILSPSSLTDILEHYAQIVEKTTR